MLNPGDPEPSDRPEVVRVGPRRKLEPALVVAALALTLVGVALWKPWGDGGQDAASPPPVASVAGIPVASNAPQPPVAGLTPQPTPAGVSRGLPAPYGLDLAFMGIVDPHADWGIAVAYTPALSIADAVSGLAPSITPVVDWQALPGSAGLAPTDGAQPVAREAGPIMDHAQTVTIAVAVTWPRMPPPRGVRLVRTGTIASPGGAVTRLRTAQPIPLSEPLPLLARLAQTGTAFDPVLRTDWKLTSGTFFLPSENRPADFGSWLTEGWHPGAYAFVITRSDGSIRTIPFVLQG